MYCTFLPYASHAGEYYATLAGLPCSIWLDSCGKGRYEILVAQPNKTLFTFGKYTEIHDTSGMQISFDDPIDLVREALGQNTLELPGVPFCGGAVGFWGYDLARRWIKLSTDKSPLEGIPDMAVGIYDWAFVIDHKEKSARLVSRNNCPETRNKLNDILFRLQQRTKTRRDKFFVSEGISSSVTYEEYVTSFSKVKNYLRDGDCYQVNLAQHFIGKASGDALDAYMLLREITPAPYSAFINFPDLQILCSSPEKFLAVKNGYVETRPIKGTVQRGRDEQSDRQIKNDLRNDQKNQAENLMIVDLLRNDLNKVCQAGSVKVNKLFEVETFTHIHHLVSTISGKLQPDKDALGVLKECFPGGSITGAPKIRAMQIIEQLEPQRRGIYCGSIGYIGWGGNMDTNIVIRTMIYDRGNIHFSVGGGIVADSRAEAEYQETLDKAAGIFNMLKLFA